LAEDSIMELDQWFHCYGKGAYHRSRTQEMSSPQDAWEALPCVHWVGNSDRLGPFGPEKIS
jgi:hypothetical protein